MRFLVDDMPCYKDECPFFVDRCYINGATTIKNYCRFTKEVCDLDAQKGYITCSGLSTIKLPPMIEYRR